LSWICSFLLITTGWSMMFIPSSNISFPIFQWSQMSFVNNPLLVMETVNVESTNFTAYSGKCLWLPNFSNNNKLQIYQWITQLPNTTACVFIGMALLYDIEYWMTSVNGYIDTPFPVGLFVDSSIKKFTFPIQGEFLNWDDDGYLQLYPATVTVNAIQIILFFCCVLFGALNLYKKYARGKLYVNLATVCICLEIACSFLMIIGRSFKLAYIVTPFPPYPYGIDLCIVFMAFSFTLASGLLLIFFWINLTSKKLYRGSLLHKAYVPALILLGIVALILWISAILWVCNVDEQTIYYISSVILALLFVIALLYFGAAYKVYNYSQNKESAHQDTFRRITTKILVSGTILIILIFFSFISSYATAISFRTACTYITSFALVGRSYIVIDIFSTEKKKKR